MSDAQKRIAFRMDVSPELNELLETMAREMRVSKSEVLRKAIVLMEIAHDAKRQGQHIGIADSREQLTREITGV